MEGEYIEYKHEQATLEAFLAWDKTQHHQRPVIFIFHAWRGRDPLMIEKAKWLASQGYVGVALDMYGKGVFGTNIEENRKLMQPFIQDRQFLLDRMRSGVDVALTHPMVNKECQGAIGFCFGGLCALDLARSGAPLKGVVSFHGLLSSPEALPQKSIQAKLLVLHGYDDPMVPRETVAAFQQEMTQQKVDWQFHTYGNTAHAFTNPEAKSPKIGAVYNPIAEKRALQAMQNFFGEIFYQE